VNFSAPFIKRPVATTLLTLGLALAGVSAYMRLPVAPLPKMDFPVLSVSASLPGASPEIVATSLAGPLERRLGTIADVTTMTSSSNASQTNIMLQFGFGRDLDGAARDVLAAINAAAADLPAGVSSSPSYRKFNPADAPIVTLALISKSLTRAQLYDAANDILQQRLSQLAGVGQVTVGGAASAAVRVDLDISTLFKYGIGLEDVSAALASANANSPKGDILRNGERWQIYTNDRASRAADYRNLVIAYRNGFAVRLSEVAEVEDSNVDLRNAAIARGEPAVLVTVFRQPGANIIETVDRIEAQLPKLAASLPNDVELIQASDRSTSIRASLADTELTLALAVVLVVGVVYLFVGDWRATLVPAVAVPVSIIGAFIAMDFLGYSLNILSLMALTIATGFVVDDAIVVLESIQRHSENGASPREAALRGARQVGFTVVSISLSLVAAFLPLLLQSGLLGRVFREFSVTLCIAVLVSLVVSLTTTPMLCSILLGAAPRRERRWNDLFSRMARAYENSLTWALRRRGLILTALGVSLVLTLELLFIIPKGFFPEQDTGGLVGSFRTDRGASFQVARAKLAEFAAIVQSDPAVELVTGSVGASGGGGGGGRGGSNGGTLSIALKPRAQRDVSSAKVMERLRPELGRVVGARMVMRPVQDLVGGGRESDALYQYTLLGDSYAELVEWTEKITKTLQHNKILLDVISDQQQNGVETYLELDRDTMSRLGLTPAQVDSTLNDAFGQRQVSTIYGDFNQFRVVMEAAARYREDPQFLRDIYVSATAKPVSGSAATVLPVGSVTASAGSSATSSFFDSARNASTNSIAVSTRGGGSIGAAVSTASETMTPLVAFARFKRAATPLAINHQGPFVASTISFNLAEGASLGEAVDEVERIVAEIHLPASIHGSMQGTGRIFQSSRDGQTFLIFSGLIAVYIVLGMLYESFVHPITILSTLPSAGLGALATLYVFGFPFDVMGLIGLFLLIGIVKKNAIMMIDFALEAQRERRLSPHDAIVEACRLRFRAIMMTSAAALLGAIPLIVAFGDGAELRRPLGVAIVGGLVASQMLTLYTTPVLYLTFSDLRDRVVGFWGRRVWR
jgi:multidrug efflux pump